MTGWQPLPDSESQSKAVSELVTVFGFVLAVSYPILALSAGVRAIFQLVFKEDVENYLAPTLSLVAALCYLAATVGFAYRARWSWRLSVSVLAFESVLTLVVGTLSLVVPTTIGSTVWRLYGADYGYFPLFQPLVGLVWLFWPSIRRQHGIHAVTTHADGNQLPSGVEGKGFNETFP